MNKKSYFYGKGYNLGYTTNAQCFDWSKFPEEILYRKCEYGKWSEIIQGTFFPNQVCQDEKGY